MRYNISIKFLAVALCALCLLCAAASGIGLVVLADSGITSQQTVQQQHDESVELDANTYADGALVAWASGKYGEMPQELVNVKLNEARSCVFQVTITGEDGTVLFSNYEGDSQRDFSYHFDQTPYEQFLQWGEARMNHDTTTDDNSGVDWSNGPTPPGLYGNGYPLPIYSSIDPGAGFAGRRYRTLSPGIPPRMPICGPC